MSIPQILYLVEGNVYTVLRFLVQIAAVLRREGERLQNVVLQQKVENKSYDDSVKLKRTEMDPLWLGQVQFRGQGMKQREPEREPERARA